MSIFDFDGLPVSWTVRNRGGYKMPVGWDSGVNSIGVDERKKIATMLLVWRPLKDPFDVQIYNEFTKY